MVGGLAITVTSIDPNDALRLVINHRAGGAIRPTACDFREVPFDAPQAVTLGTIALRCNNDAGKNLRVGRREAIPGKRGLDGAGEFVDRNEFSQLLKLVRCSSQFLPAAHQISIAPSR